jgi:tape measure domain-containing protein
MTNLPQVGAIAVVQNLSGFQSAMGKVNNSINSATSASQKLEGASGGMNKALSAVASVGMAAVAVAAVAAAAAIASVAAAATALVIEGIKTNSTLEQLQIQLEKTVGAGEETLAWVREISKETPFTAEQLASTISMAGAYGFTADEAKRFALLAGDVQAVMSTTPGVMDRVIRALGQMQARTKVAGSEMLQLTELAIPAWDILAEGMGVTVGELQDMVSKGLVPASEAIPILASAIETEFGGAMAEQSQTAKGLFETIKETIQLATADITAPLFEFLKVILTDVAAALDGLDFSGIVAEARRFATLLVTAFGILQRGDFGQKLLPAIAEAFGKLFGVFSGGPDISKIIAGIVTTINDISAALAEFITLLSGGDIEGVFMFLTGGTEGAVDVWNAITTAVDNAKDAFSGFVTGIKPFIDKQGVKIEAILDNIRGAMDEIKPLAEALSGLFTSIFGEIDWGKLGEDVGKVFGIFVDMRTTQIEKETGALKSFLEWATQATKNLTDFVETMKALPDNLSASVNRLRTDIAEKINEFFVTILGEERLEKLRESIGKLTEIFTALSEGIKEKLTSIGNTVGEKLALVGDVFSELWDRIVQGWEDFKEKFGINAYFDRVKGGTSETMDALKEKLAQIWEDIKTGAIAILGTWWEGVKVVVQKLVDGFTGLIDKLYEDIVGGSIIPDLVNDVIQWITTLKDRALDIVDSLASGIVSGLAGAGSGIISALTGGAGQEGAAPAQAGGAAPDMNAEQFNVVRQQIEALKNQFQELMLLINTELQLFVTNISTSFLTLLEVALLPFVQAMQQISMWITLGVIEFDRLAKSIFGMTSAFSAFSTDAIFQTMLMFEGIREQFNLFNEYMAELKGFLSRHWLDFVVAVQVLTKEMVEQVIGEFRRLENEVSTSSTNLLTGFEADMLNVTNLLDTNLASSLGNAAGGFNGLAGAAIDAAIKVAQAASDICESVQDAQACVTGSPELIIQHPFEDFIAYLGKSVPVAQRLISQMINPLERVGVDAFALSNDLGLLARANENALATAGGVVGGNTVNNFEYNLGPVYQREQEAASMIDDLALMNLLSEV